MILSLPILEIEMDLFHQQTSGIPTKRVLFDGLIQGKKNVQTKIIKSQASEKSSAKRYERYIPPIWWFTFPSSGDYALVMWHALRFFFTQTAIFYPGNRKCMQLVKKSEPSFRSPKVKNSETIRDVYTDSLSRIRGIQPFLQPLIWK